MAIFAILFTFSIANRGGEWDGWRGGLRWDGWEVTKYPFGTLHEQP